MPQFLAIADADQIHDYVFAPHELRLIRGGSTLQAELITKDLRSAARASGSTWLSTNGGVAIASFPDEASALSFNRLAERLFPERTASATITTACVEEDPTNFPATWARLRDRLASRKLLRPRSTFCHSNPFALPCEACAAAPAVTSSPSPEGSRWLCRACHLRTLVNPRSFVPKVPVPADLETIANGSNPVGYLAFAYFDLDRLGKHIREYGRSKPLLRHLSLDIHKAVRDSAHAAVQAVYAEGNQAAALPLLLGGDDCIIALSASSLFTFLRVFNDTYASQKFTIGPHPTYSVGVVLAHGHFPIFDLRRIAEDLLRSAKSIPRASKPNSIDFEIITSSLAADPITDREIRRLRSGGTHRTAKPYSVREFLDFAQTLARLKVAGIPSSKVSSLYNLAYLPPGLAELRYQTLLSSLETRHRLGLTSALGRTLYSSRPDGSSFTSAADAAELYAFLH